MTTVNMNLIESTPGVGGTAGPLWAQNIETNFSRIDDHDHTSGRGAALVAASINIDGDLTFNSHNATDLRSARLIDYGSATSTGTAPYFAAVAAIDKSCLLSLNGDLYYFNQSGIIGSGNPVQITSGNAVAGTPGSIGGLVAPAAVTWGALAGNLVFFADTGANTGMNLVSGGLSLVDPAAGGMAGNTINIKAPATPNTYDIVLPASGPSAGQVLKSDGSGNLSWFTDSTEPGRIPIGGIIATMPPGAYTWGTVVGSYLCTATTAADAKGFVVCAGQTIADATSPMQGSKIPYLSSDVFLAGHATAGTVGGANTKALNHTHTATLALPTHTHNLSANGGALITARNFISGSDVYLQIGQSATLSNVTFTPRDGFEARFINYPTLGASGENAAALGGVTDGVTLALPQPVVSGTTDSSLSATFDIRPSYISALFIMRIK
jgi:hypothetical protein